MVGVEAKNEFTETAQRMMKDGRRKACNHLEVSGIQNLSAVFDYATAVPWYCHVMLPWRQTPPTRAQFWKQAIKC